MKEGVVIDATSSYIYVIYLIYSSSKHSSKSVREAFKIFDRDKDGFINVGEFKTVLLTSSQKLGRHASRRVSSVWKKFWSGKFWVEKVWTQNILIDLLAKLDNSKIFFGLTPLPTSEQFFFRKTYPNPKLKNNWGPLSSTFHVGRPETLTEWKFESIMDLRTDLHLRWVGARDTCVSKNLGFCPVPTMAR